MEYYYFDTDSLVKLLFDEKGCIDVRDIYNNPDNTIICSAFSILEVSSALGQIKSAGHIFAGIYRNSIEYFNKIITGSNEDKATVRVESNVDIGQIESAKNLINTSWQNDHSIKPGDSLQLAVALKYIDLDLTIVTGDKQIIKVAENISEYTDEGPFKGIINSSKCSCSCGGIFELQGNSYICNTCGSTCEICDIEGKWCEKIR